MQGAEIATNAGFFEIGKGAPVSRVTYITILVIYVARGGCVFFFFTFS